MIRQFPRSALMVVQASPAAVIFWAEAGGWKLYTSIAIRSGSKSSRIVAATPVGLRFNAGASTIATTKPRYLRSVAKSPASDGGPIAK